MSMLNNGVPFDLLLEGIVSVLLAATIGYCAMLDRRLRAMRSGQDGLRDLIRDLSAATGQAADAIVRLREASNATGQQLSEQVTRGRSLADELALMLESGNAIADRLSNMESRRAAMPATSAVPPMPVMQPAAAPRTTPAPREAKVVPTPQHPLLDLLKRAR